MNHENILFRVSENGKIIHFEKFGSNFSKSGVGPFLNLVGLNFRPKKLGAKLSWDGEGAKKSWAQFFKMNYFSGFLIIIALIKQRHTYGLLKGVFSEAYRGREVHDGLEEIREIKKYFIFEKIRSFRTV
jgi:hypothetical protein